MKLRLTTRLIRKLMAGAALSGIVAGTWVSPAVGSEHPDIAEARSATGKFHRLEAALDDDRGLFTDSSGVACIEDPDGVGAMGVHYVKGAFVGDGVIDVTQPEALLYDLSGEKPRLLGVEYVVFVSDWDQEHPDPPVLFGHEFHLVEEGNRFGLPPFYALHAWIWSYNPRGMFEDWNPRIDC